MEIATGTRQDVPLPPGESLGGEVAWSPQSDATLALPTGGGIALWTPGAPPRAPLAATASFSRIAWTADGRSIAATTPQGTVLVSAETGEARRDPGLGGEPILAFSPDGKTLASERFHDAYETRFPGGRPHMPTQAGRAREVALFELGVAHRGMTVTASAGIEAFGPDGMAASENPPAHTGVVITADGAQRPPLPHFFLERYLPSYEREWLAFVGALQAGTAPGRVVDKGSILHSFRSRSRGDNRNP